ncbi:cytochrome P450 4C1 isoform X3 [Hydra vulgaris]|uniref:Cytochrome P450 4C1 isoform X3 n=1 Tax=Hydra vulgaris TaxID=6087 RepID=A0ABM4BR07_HYDVU
MLNNETNVNNVKSVNIKNHLLQWFKKVLEYAKYNNGVTCTTSFFKIYKLYLPVSFTIWSYFFSLNNAIAVMFLISLALIIFFIGSFFLRCLLKRIFHPLRLLPSPKEHLITGHISHFQGCDHSNTFLSFNEKFKEEGLCTLDTLYVPRYVYLVAPEFIKKILADGKHFQRSTEIRIMSPIIGNSMLTSNYEDHHWQRKLFNGAFTSQQLKNYFPAFKTHTNLLMKLWSYTCDKEYGTNLTVLNDLSNLSLDIIGDVGFGYQFNTITSHSGNEFTSAIRYLAEIELNASVFFKVLISCFPFLIRFFSLFGKRKKCSQIVYKTLNKLIEKRKKEIDNGISTEDKDIITIVLKDQLQESSKLTNDLIRDNLFLFLVAGHETTSNAMTWCLYMLGTNLKVQEKLREEIQNNILDVDNISFEEVSSLKYMDCVVKETLRLHGPAPILRRNTINATKFGEYEVPANTVLQTHVSSLHMNETIYPSPHSFKPERFMTGEIPASFYLPFGHGVYNCIGKNFALLEIKTFLVKALLQFQFSVDPKHINYTHVIWLTLKTAEPLLIRVKPIAD